MSSDDLSVDDLLVDLASRGVKMWAENDQLRLRAPKGVLTAELQQRLSELKAEILKTLSQDWAAEPGARFPLEPVLREEGAELSSLQERLWFLAQLYPQSAVYNLPNARRTRGPLDVDALHSALRAIVERHEILRTTFRNRGPGAVQMVSPSAEPDFEFVDLGGSAEPETEANRIALAESQRPFDLARGPLLRSKLLKLGTDHHLFYWCLHHIVSDGWSSMVFLRELKALYEEKTLGIPAKLPELPIQFGDFAAWERKRLRSEVLESQLSYWRRKLGGRLPVLELPADRSRPSMLSYRGSCHPFALSKTLVDGLRALGQRTETSLFTVLLAAFKVFLYRHTAVTDICVGTPIARRNRPEVADAIGCFINTLALRTDLSEDPRVEELLERVRDTCREALGRPDVPFERLVEELQPERDLSHTPIFQVMLILHVQDTRKVSKLGEVEITALEYHAPTAKFDLTLELKETEGGLEGWFEYSTDLFERETIGRMHLRLERLLRSFVEDPGSRISELELLPESERHRLLVEWNQTALPVDGNGNATAAPEASCLHHRIEAQVARTPEAVAVVCGSESLTYRALDARATRLARHLRRLGVGPDVLVGIALERSVNLLAGLLGILKAGGAYVPLDPAHPPERLAYILADARVAVLLTQARLRDGLPALAGHEDGPAIPIVCVEEILRDGAEPGADRGEEPLETGVTADRLAYVIYTSGSTGRPKGVQIPHRAVVNFLASTRSRPGLTAEDVLLAVTTASFDIAGLELFLPLTVGARVVIAPEAVATDGARLGRTLGEAAVTVMQATPATWRLLLESGWTGRPELKALCGGERLPRDLADALLTRCRSLWNLYGPTETTIWSTLHRVEPGEDPVPIGRPIADTQLYLLDEAGAPVPIGVAGELYIGGTGLARGYHGRPALTAERFIPDRFRAGPQARLYRTGDLVRYRHDGALEFLGRVDRQVKLRGHRIELGEIEAVLGAHPAVRQAVVALREDAPGDARLTGYLVPAERASDNGGAPAVSIDALRHHARQTLPAYMVPSALVVLEALPLTPNGKIDRRALPPPGPPSVEGAALVAPRDALELQLTKLWERVLHVRPIGLRDNFFDLGGHSLLAVRLLAEIDRISGHALPLATLFHAPTIEQLARVLRRDGWAPRWTSLVPIQVQGSRLPLFCVPAHLATVLGFQGLADALGPDQPVYGLEAKGWDGRETPHRRIPEMAADYLQEIRQVQPEGPYHLWGDCFGGTVAVEIAQQLHAQGESVGLLAVYESFGPAGWRSASPPSGIRRAFEPWMRRVRDEVETLRWWPLRQWPRYAREKLDRVVLRARARLDQALGRATGASLDFGAMERAVSEAVQHYEPQEYAGRIDLFLGIHWRTYRFQDRPGAWGRFARGGLRLHRVDSAPSLDDTLAEQLRTCLREAQEEKPGGTSEGSHPPRSARAGR